MSKTSMQELAKAIARSGMPTIAPPRIFKRADRGLIDKTIQFGNNVPKSKHKTRRTWLPNIQTKNIYSATLGQFVKIKVTASVQRTIDKRGGLDEYLLKEKWQDLSTKGRELRALIALRENLGKNFPPSM